MEDHAQLTFERDRLAFVGLLPLLVLALRGASSLVEAAGSLGFVSVFTLSPLIVPLTVLGVLCACAGVGLVRAWWALRRAGPGMDVGRVAALGLCVAMGVVAALLDLQGHAGKPDPGWAAGQMWDVAGACCLGVVPALLLLREGLARWGWNRGLVFKASEAAMLALAWGLAAITVPTLAKSQAEAGALRAARVSLALRIEPASADPYVIALCHASSDADFGRLWHDAKVTDATRRDAWQCVPANGREFPSERSDRFSVAARRVAVIAELLYNKDPLVIQGSRARGPCTLDEARLVRRLAEVAPELLSLLPTLQELPTDCVEDDAARTPIWWRTAHRWANGDHPTAAQLNELTEAGIKLDQPDAQGRTLAIVRPNEDVQRRPAAN